MLNPVASVSKLVFITGASSGIGLEVAKQLFKLGHTVVLGCRDESRARAAVDAVQRLAPEDTGRVSHVHLDLANLKSVRACASTFLTRFAAQPLDVLLCNAAQWPASLALTEDGYETTYQVNHLGHFLLVHLLLPAVLRADAGRIVVVSSELHRHTGAVPADPTYFEELSHRAGGVATMAPPPPAAASACADSGIPHVNATAVGSNTNTAIDAVTNAAAVTASEPARWNGSHIYALSKLYNIWFVSHLAASLPKPSQVVVNAVSPGFVPSTNLSRSTGWLRRTLMRTFGPWFPFAISTQEGARRVVDVCVGQTGGRTTGQYFAGGVEKPVSEEGRSVEKAAELWRLSCKAVGIEESKYLPAAAAVDAH